MTDLPVAWKKIMHGLSRGRRYTDDRIPTIEELTKLLEYLDRRIKAVVYTMASSGIRLGAWESAVLSGPTGVLLQMSDIKLTPNAPKEKNNDR